MTLAKASSSAPATTPALPVGTRVVTLENGLTLILREDRSAPVVSVQAWARTGSIHEGRWLGAGLSHVLEHMLFKGTTTRGPGEIDRQVQDAGGYMNAYTSFDRTVYHIDLPSTGTRVAVDILCDIMQNAALPADELGKELDVIRREMDMGQDDPGSRSSRRLFETAYTRSNHRHTIIGYRDIFDTLTREDIFAYYRERYAPNNVFFVVAGDFLSAEVEKQIRDAYAAQKSRALPPLLLPEEPRQVAPREVIEEDTVELGHLHFAWHIPDVRHDDAPLLDVLAALLGQGRSSRLYQQVREKKALVHFADAWTYSPGQPGLFGVSASVDGDKFDAARAALLEEVERLCTKPVTAAELEKAVKQFTAATLSSRKTMAGQAQDLGGNWIAVHDLNFSTRYLDAVRRTTPAALLRVARTYLTPENRTLYALLPKGSSKTAAVTVTTAVTAPVQLFTLPNGLRLLVKEDHRLPFVEFRTAFRGGVLAETEHDSGVTLLMAKLLMKGTRSRSGSEIASTIESVGGSLDTYGGNNSFGVNCEVMSGDFALGLDLVSDVILQPSFPTAAFAREREAQLADIRDMRDQLLKSCGRLMRETLFGKAGYGMDARGSEASLARLSAAAVRHAHTALAAPTNCVLAIFGDVKTAQVRKAVQEKFKSWSGRETVPGLTPPPVLREVLRVGDTRDKQQAVLVISFAGATMFSEDRFALDLIQESCSDLGSRLFARIREKLGLAYYVGAQNFLGLTPGFFCFYVGTEPAKVALCEQEILAEAALLAKDGLTAAELKRSKAKIVGQKKIARQDLGGHAMQCALDELYGFGHGRSDEDDAKYEAVTLKQAQAVAKRYFKPDAFVVSVVKP